MELITKEFAETATTNSLASVNPCEEARMNKLLKSIFDNRKPPNGLCSFRVPFALTHVVMETVQKMIDYDSNIEFTNIMVDDLKLRIDYKTHTHCRYVPELQEMIVFAQVKIDRIIHQKVLMSLKKRRS